MGSEIIFEFNDLPDSEDEEFSIGIGFPDHGFHGAEADIVEGAIAGFTLVYGRLYVWNMQGSGWGSSTPGSEPLFVKMTFSDTGYTYYTSTSGSSWTYYNGYNYPAGFNVDLLRSSRVYIGNAGAAPITLGSINPALGPQVPTASFTATPTSGRAPLAVNFTDTSRGIPTNWYWNFGDGTTSTQQNPTKTYSTPGTYTVQLTASNSLGTNTITRSALITAQATIISPASIPSAEAFEQPSFSPGITYVGLDSAPSSEAFEQLRLNMQLRPESAARATTFGDLLIKQVIGLDGIPSAEAVSPMSFTARYLTDVGGFENIPGVGEPRLSMQLRPSSVSSAEAFGMLTTKLVFGLEGIPSAESVSPVSFTTQFITAAGEIPSEEGFGTLLNTMFMSAFGDIAPEAAVEAPSFIQSAPPPPPPTDWSAVGKQDEKYYLYKISKHDGTYVGVWVDVADDLEFTERINSPGTTTTVRLARSANTTREMRANLLTQGGDYLTTEDGARLVSVYETPNTVGEGTDVELNYNVDIYVHYGEFARLVTQLGEPIVTEDGDNIMVVSGAPLGTRVFSGYVLDYDASYGEESSVWVTVVSHGNELSDQEVLDGEKTNVRFSGSELSVITKNILDTNPGRMSYSSVSLPSTGVTQTMDFQLNTKLEAIQSIYDQTPDGWYWYGDVAENLIYMRPVSTGYDHTFVIGWHVKALRIRRSMEGLKNRVYFVGGQTDPNNPATTKFKKYENPTSQTQWRVGLERITDRRYTVDASMLARGNKVLSAGAGPVWTTTVTITSGRYDIESIKIGQTVGFKNSGNYIDGVPPLQIVSKTYTPTAVTLELGALLDRQVDTLSKTEKALNNEQYQNLPNTPS